MAGRPASSAYAMPCGTSNVVNTRPATTSFGSHSRRYSRSMRTPAGPATERGAFCPAVSATATTIGVSHSARFIGVATCGARGAKNVTVTAPSIHAASRVSRLRRGRDLGGVLARVRGAGDRCLDERHPVGRPIGADVGRRAPQFRPDVGDANRDVARIRGGALPGDVRARALLVAARTRLAAGSDAGRQPGWIDGALQRL